MKVFTLVLSIWLLPKVNTLNCYECLSQASGTCNAVSKQCLLQDHQCGAVRVVTYAGQSKVVDMDIKSCVLAQECINGSINLGTARTAITSKCCNSDLCNSQPAPEMSKSSPNGKKCFSCVGETCTNTLNCEGDEDHCIKTTVKVGEHELTMKGCASKTICSSEAYAQLEQAIGSGFNCCQGDLCNSVGSVAAGLLLLVVPLISSVLFS